MQSAKGTYWSRSRMDGDTCQKQPDTPLLLACIASRKVDSCAWVLQNVTASYRKESSGKDSFYHAVSL